MWSIWKLTIEMIHLIPMNMAGSLGFAEGVFASNRICKAWKGGHRHEVFFWHGGSVSASAPSTCLEHVISIYFMSFAHSTLLIWKCIEWTLNRLCSSDLFCIAPSASRSKLLSLTGYLHILYTSTMKNHSCLDQQVIAGFYQVGTFSPVVLVPSSKQVRNCFDSRTDASANDQPWYIARWHPFVSYKYLLVVKHMTENMAQRCNVQVHKDHVESLEAEWEITFCWSSSERLIFDHVWHVYKGTSEDILRCFIDVSMFPGNNSL